MSMFQEEKISFSYAEIFISSELIFFILKFRKIKRMIINSEEITQQMEQKVDIQFYFNYFHYTHIHTHTHTYNVRIVLDREDGQRRFIDSRTFFDSYRENGTAVSANGAIFKYLPSLLLSGQSHLKDNHEFGPIKIIPNIQTAFDSQRIRPILILRPFRIVLPVYL